MDFTCAATCYADFCRIHDSISYMRVSTTGAEWMAGALTPGPISAMTEKH
ncbi:hypothetical protein SBC2_09280 [Caballeronia sp. SBC2]|nr:hypothetical protein SBC2_09280 [Caballeronia sp. SBC2]